MNAPSRTDCPKCAGSRFYGPHGADVERSYTVVEPGGRVVWCCDTDCLQHHLNAKAPAPIGRSDRL
jgi:hypothetical protein